MYVDTYIPTNKRDFYLTLLNYLDPDILFTCEIEENVKLPFLNLLQVSDNDRIRIDLSVNAS